MASSSHSNNFDFLRLAAAISVWYGHCYALTGGDEPMSQWVSFESFGSLGVTVFFIISGYFVTLSYDSRNHFLSFMKNRILRIMPALCMVVLLSIFILGPLMTSLSFQAYFSDSITWRYLRSALVFPLQYDLPGVFRHNPQSAVNGSLWTLQHEVRLYFAIALLGVLGILQPRLMFVLLIALFGIRVYGLIYTPDAKAFVLGVRWSKLELAIRLASQFACGAFLYLAEEKLPRRKEYFLTAALVIAATIYWPTPASNLIFDAAFAYTVIYLGFLKLPLLPAASKYGDFSYGFYLYAFPVQQSCIHLFGAHMDFTRFLCVTFSLTLLCAIFSWNFVEKQALKLKA
jgi:peptidoglycan/LPS O-acetylase OafA/YrhL